MVRKKQNRSTATLQDAQKTENTAQLQPSFSLKDKCSELTVGDYIQLICHDDTSVLVKEGMPDKLALQDAKMAVIFDYATLSGGSNLYGSFDYYNAIMGLKCDLLQIRIAVKILPFEWDKAVEMLKACGARASKLDKDNLERTMDHIESVVALKTTQLEKALTDYNKRASKTEDKKTTEADIRREMVLVGGDGIIPDDCNLATYAAKVRVYRERNKAIEDAKRRTVSKK